MDQTRLRRLKSILYNQIPLVGGGLRRMAARQLAACEGPAAVRTLAEACITIQDAQLQEIALAAIDKITEQAEINAVTEIWQRSRHPELETLILQHGWVADRPPIARALSAIKVGRLEFITQGRAELAGPLLTLCEDQDPEIAQTARSCLKKLTGRYITDAVCALWAGTRNPILEEAVLQAGYTARAPDSVRILTSLKTGQLEGLNPTSSTEVKELAAACLDGDRTISVNAEAVISRLQDPRAQQIACKLVFENENQGLVRAVVKGGFLPEDETDRSQFLFLTSQWGKYETLDFDSQRLRLIYETAEQSLRERITQQVRASGRSDFLKIIAGRDFQGRLDLMSDVELGVLVQLLAEQEQNERLWELVFRLPLRWSQLAVLGLKNRDWLPTTPEDQQIYQKLKDLASPEIANNGLAYVSILPPAVRRARVHLAQGRINCVAFSHQGTSLAMGTSRRKAILWDFKQAETAAVIGGFDHSIGSLAFSRDDGLVLGERSSSTEEVCSVYYWNGSQVRIVHQGRGSISTVALAGEGTILAAQRDNRVSLIDLQHGFKRRERRLYFWPRAMCVSPNQERAVLLHNGVHILDLPELGDSARSAAWSHVARSASFFPDGNRIAVGKYNGEVVFLHASQLTVDRQPLAEHKGWVQGVAVLRKHPLLISAGSEGYIIFTHWENRSQLGKLGRPGDQITSLHISADEQFMAIGHADSTVSLWDLRVLDLPSMLEQPFDLATPNQLAALWGLLQNEQIATIEEMGKAVHNALVFSSLVLQHRFRFDIEIDAVPEIKLGDFEIEIE